MIVGLRVKVKTATLFLDLHTQPFVHASAGVHETGHQWPAKRRGLKLPPLFCVAIPFLPFVLGPFVLGPFVLGPFVLVPFVLL